MSIHLFDVYSYLLMSYLLIVHEYVKGLKNNVDLIDRLAEPSQTVVSIT